MILLLLLYSLFIQNTNTSSVVPDISNSSGDYYFLSDNSNPDKLITCNNPTGCYIDCQGFNACKDAQIRANISEWLVLKCNAKASCWRLQILDGPRTTANIQCASPLGESCYSAIFFLNNTNTVNLQCSTETTNLYDGGCYFIQFYAQNANEVMIDCMGRYGCYLMSIHIDSVSNRSILNANGYDSMNMVDVFAWNSNQLEINCNARDSCQLMDVYPPYHDEYVFRLFCLSVENSCGSIDITIRESAAFIDNYMEMICSRTDKIVGICQMEWYCLDISNSAQTKAIFNADQSRWKCEGDTCCPWSDTNNIQQITTIPTILYGSISPNITNTSGEWYILESSSMNTLISCRNSAGCFIECTATRSCQGATIYAGLTNHLSIQCRGQESCNDMYISQGPIIEADIYCTSLFGEACSHGTFIMDDTEIVNLECATTTTTLYEGGCYDLKLWAQYAKSVKIDCNYNYDCYYAEFHVDSVSESIIITSNGSNAMLHADIYARFANALDIDCNAALSCESLNIFPPYDGQYKFKMLCAPYSEACDNVEIEIPKSYTFTTNYMELICPTTKITEVCDIKWSCLDLTTSSSSYTTKMVYIPSNSRYECEDTGAASRACCPWKQPENMLKPPTLSPTTNPSVMPSIPTLYPTVAPTSITNDPTVVPTSSTNDPTTRPTVNTTSAVIIITETDVNVSTTQFFTTSIKDDESSKTMDIFGFNVVEFVIIIVGLIVVILVIFTCIYCCKINESAVNPIFIKHAMVIIIAIGDYDDEAESPNEELTNVMLSDLELENDIKNLSQLFGSNVLNYRIYPENENKKLHWTQDEIIELLTEKAKELESNLNIYDGLIVCISSHGLRDHICTSDYQLISKLAIHRIFSQNHPESRNIPRIFLFDCCDGNMEHGKAISVNSNENNKETDENNKFLSDMEKQQSIVNDGEEEDNILDRGKNFTLSDIEQTNSSIWAHNTKNPDFQLVEINAANPGFQSKLNTQIGSYMIYEFVKKTINNFNGDESEFLGDIFDEIQNELENKGKQQTKNVYNNNTRFIKLKKKRGRKSTAEMVQLNSKSPQFQ